MATGSYAYLFICILCIALVGSKPILESASHEDHSNETDDHHGHEHGHGHGRNHTQPKTRAPKTTAYIYGTMAVTLISLLSLGGVVFLPCMKRKIFYDSVMLLFMALAVGTMTTDAVLHLIPETLGLHGHSHGDHDEGHHEHEHGSHEEHEGHEGHEESPEYIGKMVALLATLYGLYLLELAAKVVSKLVKKNKISSEKTAPKPIQAISMEMSDGLSTVDGSKKLGLEHHTHTHAQGHSHDHPHGLAGAFEDSETTILGLKSVAFVIVISDAMHNFTDGLAVGAAFAKSSAAGLAVSIAVVCHEVPHEIGNFAILLNTGMSFKKALLLNFFSAVTCFAGLYPGIVAGQQEALAKWIFAAVAGGFLYVALVHMLRELQHFDRLPLALSVLLQNIGLLVGFGLIFLLAIYEEALENIG